MFRLVLVLCSVILYLVVPSVMAVCPTSSQDFYSGASSVGCDTTCVSTLCSCLGRGVPSSFGNSTVQDCVVSSTVSCSSKQTCLAGYVECLNTVADAARNISSQCSTWASPIFTEELLLAADAQYNTSSIWTSCRAQACAWGEATTCQFSTPHVCLSPVLFRATLVLNGTVWATILSNATLTAQLIQILEGDLTNALQFPATVHSVISGSLIVDFSVPTSSSNAVLAANLQTISTSFGWLAGTQAFYTANGGTGIIVVISITEVGGTGVPTPTGPVSFPPTSEPNEGPACNVGCWSGIIVGVTVLLILILVGYACCKKRNDPAHDRQPYNE